MASKTVAVWKNTWLPFSETFIRDQVSALDVWRATTMGFHNSRDGIMDADCAPYPFTRPGRTARRILGVQGKQQIYLKHLRDNEAQVLHAHFGSGGVYSLRLAHEMNIPHLTTFHGADTHMFGTRIPGVERRYRRALSRLFVTGDRFMAASDYLASQLVKHGAPADKIDVLYTGTRPVPKVTVAEKQGIAFLGRLTSIKGADHLLQAVSSFRAASARQVHVSIAGDGPQRDYLERLARSLGVNCKFVGRIDAAKVPGFLAQHEIFCAPSLPSASGTREGFGMVFLEAALQELPVVSYASGGVVEAVKHGETGLLAPEADIKKLAEHLEFLLLDSDYARVLGQAGRSRVQRDFDINCQAQKLQAVYSKVVD